MTEPVSLEVDLDDFIDWLREQSHQVGYRRVVYLYSKDGVEAKRLLNRLMFLDCISYWGWSDDYVEYCSARSFVPRIQSYREIIQGGSHVELVPFSSKEERQHSHGLPYVTLSLFDLQELSHNERETRAVLDICQPLAERDAYVLLTGNGYPSDVFKDQLEMTRFLLGGFVVKVEGEKVFFEGERPILQCELPFPEFLICDSESMSDELTLKDCEELLFSWELMCTWKTKYELFDFDLFKDCFVGTWKLFQTKTSTEDHRYRLQLLMLMSVFVGQVPYMYISFLTDYGLQEETVVYGNDYELLAARIFTCKLIRETMNGDFHKGNGIIDFRHRIFTNVHNYWKPEKWIHHVSLSTFEEDISDLICVLKEAKSE